MANQVHVRVVVMLLLLLLLMLLGMDKKALSLSLYIDAFYQKDIYIRNQMPYLKKKKLFLDHSGRPTNTAEPRINTYKYVCLNRLSTEFYEYFYMLIVYH